MRTTFFASDRATYIVTTGAGADNQGPLALPVRSASMATGVHHLASELVLAWECWWHFWLSAAQPSRQHDVGDLHASFFGLAVPLSRDCNFPSVLLGVVSGLARVDCRLAPGIDLENVNVRFQEVGEFSSRREDRPVGREGEEWQVVGVDGVVQGQGLVS